MITLPAPPFDWPPPPPFCVICCWPLGTILPYPFDGSTPPSMEHDEVTYFISSIPWPLLLLLITPYLLPSSTYLVEEIVLEG